VRAVTYRSLHSAYRLGLGIATLALCLAGLFVAPTHAHATTLADTLKSMQPELDRSPFGRPLVLRARQGADGLEGEVFAIVDHSPSEVSRRLALPQAWCAAMLLHLDNRSCSVDGSRSPPALTLGVVRKFDQPVQSANRIVFAFTVHDASPSHFEAQLFAASGPLGTSDYRIRLEAIPVGEHRSFVHFAYAYRTSTLTDLGLQAYLATLGRTKVGFSEVGKNPDGTAELVRGAQGLLERNAIRYFLAFDAFLDGKDPLAWRSAWYTSTEKYARQLHEVDRQTYLRLKAADALAP